MTPSVQAALGGSGQCAGRLAAAMQLGGETAKAQLREEAANIDGTPVSVRGDTATARQLLLPIVHAEARLLGDSQDRGTLRRRWLRVVDGVDTWVLRDGQVVLGAISGEVPGSQLNLPSLPRQRTTHTLATTSTDTASSSPAPSLEGSPRSPKWLEPEPAPFRSTQQRSQRGLVGLRANESRVRG